MASELDIQRALSARGYDTGKAGEKTASAIMAFQRSVGLKPDGIVGPMTTAALFPPKVEGTTAFDKTSLKNLNEAHPLLQPILIEARKEVEFRILDSSRGRVAQEAAFNAGRSKAHFGQSAHNWLPAIAVDLFPAPYDWNNGKAFDKLAAVVMRIAKAKKVPLRWGGDWDGDGDTRDQTLTDKPHFELTPWRTYAKDCKPYAG